MIKKRKKVTALERGRALETRNVLLLKSGEVPEGGEGTLPLLLCFLLITRVKVTSSASGISTAISTSGEGVGIGIEP